MNNEQILNEISKMEATLAKLKAELQKPEAPEPWKPLPNDVFWVVNLVGETNAYCYKNDMHEKYYNSGNCFPTEKRAAQVAEKFRMLLKLEQLHDMFCPDYVPDWNDGNETKYFVLYDSRTKIWDVQDTEEYKEAVNVWFDSPETAEKVVDILNKEGCNSECK